MSLSHFDHMGNAIMVDVSEKQLTKREAIAKGKIKASSLVIQSILEGKNKKGDVLNVARIAGILGLKQTANLIPMCHTILIEKSSIDFNILEKTSEIEAICTVSTTGKTGVEMEAITGVTIALLTIYDMCKSIDKKMSMEQVHLYKKTGGKSGTIINDIYN